MSRNNSNNNNNNKISDNAGADVTYAITDVTVANVPDDIHH
jgi:hypothetical protein